jgi:Gas vesicle synthesis protein GvpO
VHDVKPQRRDSGASERTGSPRRRGLSTKEVAARARNELVDITGLPSDAVTSLERRDDGIWKVTVELLELSRIPETDDLLGTYEATVDSGGELIGYRRVRRYARSRSLVDDGRLC